MFGISWRKPLWDIDGASWAPHPGNRRFAIWNGGTSSPADDVVLDRETRLVWERSPSTDQRTFDAAVVYSTTRLLAQRKGWRLPALEELLSLVDLTTASPTLPAGHPFLNVQLDNFYWSMSQGIPVSNNPHLVWGYNFGNGDTASVVASGAKTCCAWLVRGGYGHNYPR